MWTLTDVEHACRASWGVDTCDPVDRAEWHPGNPARGQCGVTALVLHDLFGGELVLGEVRVAGERTGVHWWNRFGAGLEVDLTRDQFRQDEEVVGGQVVERPPGPPKRCRAEYELLRDRVLRLATAPPTTSPGAAPAPSSHAACG
ncbi:YunG family protein [Actinophytocola sp. KF-1]